MFSLNGLAGPIALKTEKSKTPNITRHNMHLPCFLLKNKTKTKTKPKSAIKSFFSSFAQNNLHCPTTIWRTEFACQESEECLHAGTVDCRFLTACVQQCNFIGGSRGGRNLHPVASWGWRLRRHRGGRSHILPGTPGSWRRFFSCPGLPSSPCLLGHTPSLWRSFSRQSL